MGTWQPPRLAVSLHRLAGGLLDLVYPPRCLVCERYDSPPLCETCSAAFTALPEPVCDACGRPIEPDQTGPCRTCEAHHEATGSPFAFEAARAAGIFEGPLRLALHRLKYHQGESLGESLGSYLANRLVVDRLFGSERLTGLDWVAAVPMHPRKERSRGFNQARLLAAPVAEMLGLPLLPSPALRRIRSRPAQVGLSADLRRRNLREAFQATDRSNAPIAGRGVLLIDDVFTTGATVEACAAALREAGTSRVLVATLAGGG
ncbi:MAG: ComF family protein [Cytophagales bacterium]|nr:ComF family protein [Armatimonadota bacterium]